MDGIGIIKKKKKKKKMNRKKGIREKVRKKSKVKRMCYNWTDLMTNLI